MCGAFHVVCPRPDPFAAARPMTQHALRLLHALQPSRKTVVLAVELSGLAAIAYGASLISHTAAWVAGGLGLILEAYALERR